MSGIDGYGTGHGTTIAFTTLQGTYVMRAIPQLHQETGESADVSHLGSSNSRRYVPPDLMSVSPFVLEVLFDTEATLGLPLARTRDTNIIITFPFRGASANDTQATISGAGWVVRRDWGNLQSNVEQIARLEIQFEVVPTFSAELNAP